MNYTTFEYVALGIWVLVITILVYGIIIIHDIPAKIARKRNHPYQEAIEAASWLSLFLLHTLWPFLWIWAMSYNSVKGKKREDLKNELEKMKDRILVLETKSEVT